MLTSDPCTDLLNALLAARLEFPTITRNREGFSKRGGQKYQYADLNVIIDTTVPILGQHGLLLVQAIEDSAEGQLRIISTLFHAASGQWMSADVSVSKPDDMQNFGMTCTYVKRYAQQALLNISTEDDDDAASLNGSSKPAMSKPAAAPLASTNGYGHTPAPESEASLEHPTEGHLAALRNLAVTECGEDVEVYEDRIRRTMKIPKQASVSPRLLTKTMTMTTYMELFEFYRRLESQLAKGKETSRGPESTAEESAASQPAPSSTGEANPAVPSPPAASSSAPAPDAAAERDRERLRHEIQAWDLRISPAEIEHVIVHNSYSRARTLLWGARRQPPAATLMAPVVGEEGSR